LEHRDARLFNAHGRPGILERVPQAPDDAAASWSGLIEAAGPASLLVVIHARMGETLRSRVAPEDILQEVLLQAWRDRGDVQWHGPQAFRSWLLTLIDHRLADAADHFNAVKRGGPGIGTHPDPSDARRRDDPMPDPPLSTTPSRLASCREQSELMRRALDEVPDDCRDVVRLRLFDEMPAATIAVRLGIGESAVRHRFRRGAAVYRVALSRMLSTSAQDHAAHAPETRGFRS
jgi:RNA polymerase sigma factor (sigma-70 family)